MERTNLLTSFQDFGLADPISRALKEENYLTPTPIQAQTIPLAIAGRDVVGIAQTGTGKTAAFALPILSEAGLRCPLPFRIFRRSSCGFQIRGHTMQKALTHVRPANVSHGRG
jgi:superfamily II DNA/RNA helicase